VPGPKLNERPVLRTRLEGKARPAEPSAVSARAVARYVRTSPYKVREVLDLIRGHQVDRAQEILRFCERDAATLVSKVLTSAVANAEHTDQVVSDDLYVSACFADEGPTLKRWRPRARGRATRIRKRTSHVTVIVSRLPESELARRRTSRPAATADRRRRRGGAEGRAARRREAQASDAQAPEPEASEAVAPAPETAAEAAAPTEAEVEAALPADDRTADEQPADADKPRPEAGRRGPNAGDEE
jgi:large subunit ribosomal protein L22